ncbi:MAG: hypothetical protein ACON38_00385 [Akkermansiaceae bacterium]
MPFLVIVVAGLSVIMMVMIVLTMFMFVIMIAALPMIVVARLPVIMLVFVVVVIAAAMVVIVGAGTFFLPGADYGIDAKNQDPDASEENEMVKAFRQIVTDPLRVIEIQKDAAPDAGDQSEQSGV